MILSELQVAMADECVCCCCKEALGWDAAGWDVEGACNCDDYPINEQCDCWFCEGLRSR